MEHNDQEITISLNDLPNLGVLNAQVPDSVLAPIKEAVQKIIDDKFAGGISCNNRLLGHMEHEYDLNDIIPEIEPFFIEMANIYNQRWDVVSTHDINTLQSSEIRLTDIWVNIQQKHEFNPPHVHSGLMSFVIWLNIPYNLEDEAKVFPPVSSEYSRTSVFSFHYNYINGLHNHFTLGVDKTYEGAMILFPANLSHSVMPFYTSDGYRISVAGNIKIVPK